MKWKKTFITLHLRLTEYFENEDDITFDEVTQLLVKNKATSPPLGLQEVHQSKIIQEAMQVQNSEYIKIYKPSDFTCNLMANCCRSKLPYLSFE